jgi:phenylpyruvate tautomerase PptA (4-oxalocrotonate tautomerase family)
MPISVSAPHGVLTATGEREVLPRLTQAVLAINGAEDNDVFRSIVGGHVELHEPGHVYAGGRNRPVVVVSFAAPHSAFTTNESRQAFIEAATRIVDECAVPGHDRENTWVNIFNAPNGAWGIGGVAYDDESLTAKIVSGFRAAG